MSEPTTAEKAATILAGVEFAAAFVPKSRARLDWDSCLNWECTIKANGHTLAVPYGQGSGHIPGYLNLNSRAAYVREAIDYAAEHGRYTPANRIGAESVIAWRKELPKPNRDDVLSCLLNDATAMDAGSFEAWCAEFGTDADSRKMERSYNACIATGLKLRLMFGDEGCNVLREHYSELGL
jgi:hypothetical protein